MPDMTKDQALVGVPRGPAVRYCGGRRDSAVRRAKDEEER